MSTVCTLRSRDKVDILTFPSHGNTRDNGQECGHAQAYLDPSLQEIHDVCVKRENSKLLLRY